MRPAHRVDQFTGIVTGGARENLLNRSVVHLLSVVQDGDGIGDLPHDREIMRHEDVGEAEIPLQFAEQGKYLR